jgi:hypothetical protein
VQAFRAELDAALDRGRAGLRVAADITALAEGTLESRRQLHVYERLADTLIGSSALTGMCLYDAALGDEVLGPLTVLHAVQRHGERQPLAHLSGRGARLALHGEIADHLAGPVFTALFDLASAVPAGENIRHHSTATARKAAASSAVVGGPTGRHAGSNQVTSSGAAVKGLAHSDGVPVIGWASVTTT